MGISNQKTNRAGRRAIGSPALKRLAVCGFTAFGLYLASTGSSLGAEDAQPKPTPSPKKLIQEALGAYLVSELKTQRFQPGAAAFIRIFKETSELEIWLSDDQIDGRYRLFKTYKICKWSGKIGPKLFEGDLQSPEGFYAFSPWQLRPQSRNFRAIDIGFPNEFDVGLGRTGSDIQIHGGCGSVGCFAMTDEGVDEIFRLVAAAFGGGQRQIMVHAFPFRLTDKALAKRKTHPWIKFWKNLKPAHDAFEATRKPPTINICGAHYALNSKLLDSSACIALKAPTATIAARRHALARASRPQPRIKVMCNLKLPSCRKWLFLRKRILARKDAANRRKLSKNARSPH